MKTILGIILFLPMFFICTLICLPVITFIPLSPYKASKFTKIIFTPVNKIHSYFKL